MTQMESGRPVQTGQLLGNILLTNALGVATYANEGIAFRTGFSVAEILGAKPGRLWGGRMPRSFYDEMWRTIRDKRSSFVGSVTNRSKAGREYAELLTVCPLEGSDGSVQYLALRPAAIEDADRFVREWRAVFKSPSIAAAPVVSWLSEWFPGELSQGAERDTGGFFSDWTLRHWSGVLRDRFQRRFDDRALIAAAKADPQAYQAIYEKYFETIERYFMRHLPGQRDQAFDLAQDTFIRAFERLDGYETRNAAYGTYLLRIAHSILLNSFRRQPMVDLSLTEAPSVMPAPELSNWIWEIPELTVRERLALSAYYREGYSVREMSVRFECSENAAKLLLSRARKKLRPLLSGS